MNEIKLDDVMKDLIPTMETRRFVFGKKFRDLDVYKIPLKYLSYNKNNGRIFLGVNEKEKDGIDFDELSKNDYNNEIEKLIWDYDENKNVYTKNSIEDVGQLEVALISENGIIIDGNRRFTCVRRLNREQPENEEYKYLKACIIKIDREITARDIKKYELNVQFGKDEKADYHLTDKVMSIYREVEEDVLSIEEIAEEMNLTRNKVNNFIITAEMINEFLEYYKINEKYFIIDKFSYVNPLEVVAKYVNQGKVRQELSEEQIESRKNIFFELLIGARLSLPTQELRDSLIRDIYKKNPDLCEDFIEEYDKRVSPLMFELITNQDDDLDFYQFKDELKDSEAVKEMNKVYQKYKDKSNIQNTLDGQINLAEKALENIRNIDINMFENVDNPEILGVFEKVKSILNDTNKEILGIIGEDE